MKQRYKWLLTGIVAGLVVLILYLLFDKVLHLVSFSFWIVIGTPAIIGLFGFLSGLFVETTFTENISLKSKNNNLQKDMMDQALKLSTDINSAMEDLQKRTDQLDIIVNNINSGICFIDKEYKIETGYNDTFVQIFGDQDYQDNSIMNSVFNVLDNDTKSSIADYLELCFTNKTASPSMLNEANPIKEFEFVQVVGGSVVHTIINSSIIIIKNKDKEIEKIMFVFDDITSSNELKQELEKRDKEYSKRYSIMVALFGNDKKVIKRFIDGLEEDVETLSLKIKELKQNEKNNNTISDILGTVHSIKGEAFALGFEKLSGIAGEFETFFKKIKDKVLGLESNLEIIGFFEKLNNEKREFDKTISTLEAFLAVDEDNIKNGNSSSSGLDLSSSVAKHLEHENISFDLLRKELELINKSAAKEIGKKSVFTLNTSVKGIDSKKYKLLKELFLHMLRNSIAHGIELPIDRLEAGKDSNGNITLDILKVDNSIIFEYTDDGTGFDVEKIKKRAIELSIVTEDEIAKMSNMDIIKIVFNDGFSTSDSTDMVSGVGVGMSVVKKNIFKELKGKISLTNRPGRGIKIRITIPV